MTGNTCDSLLNKRPCDSGKGSTTMFSWMNYDTLSLNYFTFQYLGAYPLRVIFCQYSTRLWFRYRFLPIQRIFRYENGAAIVTFGVAFPKCSRSEGYYCNAAARFFMDEAGFESVGKSSWPPLLPSDWRLWIDFGTSPHGAATVHDKEINNSNNDGVKQRQQKQQQQQHDQLQSWLQKQPQSIKWHSFMESMNDS